MERIKKFWPKLRQISLRPSVSLDRLPFALPPAGLSRLVLLLDDYSARSIPYFILALLGLIHAWLIHVISPEL